MHVSGLLEVMLEGSGGAPPVPCFPPTASSLSPPVLASMLWVLRWQTSSSSSVSGLSLLRRNLSYVSQDAARGLA